MQMKEEQTMKRTQASHHWGTFTGIVAVMIVVGIGLFLYHNFFRQAHAELVEIIPPDAAFILQLNDNDDFVKTSTQLRPFLSDFLTLDALPGLEFFMDKFHEKNGIVISCHTCDNAQKLLLSTQINERTFKELLNSLRIDPRNFVPFDNVKIYSFGTHYKKFNFTFHNNFFTISEDVDLLKKSIVQIKNPRNILSNRNFSSLYEQIIQKNQKQNWLIIQNSPYFERSKSILPEEYRSWVAPLTTVSEWSAFIIRLRDKDLYLSGYILGESPFFGKFKGQPADGPTDAQIVPLSCLSYLAVKTPDPTRFAAAIQQQDPSGNRTQWDYFNKILPVATLSFQWGNDSLTYHYLAVKIDSTLSNRALLLPDSAQHKDNIYKGEAIHPLVEKGRFNTLLSALHPCFEMTCYVERDGYYVFSDTVDALKQYINHWQSSFAQQPLYKFMKSNMPSASNFEFCYISPEPNPSFSGTPGRSPQAPGMPKYPQSLRDVEIFAYSFLAPQKGFVPVNVYIKIR